MPSLAWAFSTDHSLTTRQGNLVFFIIAPTNISVLPEDSIEARINALLNIIRGVDGTKLMAADSMLTLRIYNRIVDPLERPGLRNAVQKRITITATTFSQHGASKA